jgi:hypothetical protein
MGLVRRWLHRNLVWPALTPNDLVAVSRYLNARTWNDLVRELRSHSALLLRPDVQDAILETARAETDETRQGRLAEGWPSCRPPPNRASTRP